MNIKKKKGRLFLAGFLICMMIVNLLSGNNVGVSMAHGGNWEDSAEVTKGGIKLSKTITGYNPDTKEFDVELNVENNADVVNDYKSLDAVLLIDASKNKEIDKVKKAAKKIVNKLIPESGKGNLQVGVITLENGSKEFEPFTDNISKLETAINGVNSEEGTYTKEGLKAADDMLKKSAADKKVIVVVSDEDPVYAYTDYQNFDLNKKVQLIKAGNEPDILSDILIDIAKNLSFNKIENGRLSDILGDYVEYIVDSMRVFKIEKGSQEESVYYEAKNNFLNNTITIKNIDLNKGETLKVKYKIRLKDEYKDGKHYPSGAETTFAPTLSAKKINFNIPKIWADEVTRRLTVKKLWYTYDWHKNIDINITAKDGYKKTLKLGTYDTEKGIDLPVYDNNGQFIEYTVSEKQDKIPNIEYITSVKIDNNKVISGNSISFTFEKVGEKIQGRKITFTNNLLKSKPIRIRKVWKGEKPKEVKFNIFANEGDSYTMAGRGETIDTLKLTAEDAKQGNPDVWEKVFNLKLPNYRSAEELYKDGYKELIYDVEEIGDNGKRVVYNTKKSDEDLNNRYGFVKKHGFVKLGGNIYEVVKSLADDLDDDCDTYTFVNTLVKQDETKRSVKITKTWIGDKGRADFGLFKKGETQKLNYTMKTSKEGNDTLVSFENVEITDKDGNVIDYEIKELDAKGKILNDGDILVSDGKRYKVLYDVYGNITNAETIDITVKKDWDENVPLSEHKSAEISLTNKDNKKTISIVLNTGNKWEYVFKDLPKNLSGYSIKETKINGLEVNENIKQLYNVPEPEDSINDTQTVKITNSFAIPEDCLKVLKVWDPDVKKQEVTVTSFAKVRGRWLPRKMGTAPGVNNVEEVEGLSECVIVRPGEPSPASLPKIKEPVFAQTPAPEKQIEKVHSMSNKAASEGVWLADNNESKFAILETAIGDVKLTDDEIQKILNSDNLDVIKYKLGEYDVTVNKITDNMFIINNSGKKIPEKPGKTTPGAITPEVPTTPVTPTPSNPTTPVTPTPSNPTTPVNPTPSNPTTPVNPTPSNPTVPVTPTPSNPTVPVTPVPPTPTVTTPTIPSYPISNTPNPNDPNSPDEFVAVGNDGTPQGKFIKKTKPNGELEYVLEEDGTPLSGFKAKNGVVSSTGKSIEERPGLPETGGTSNAWYYGAGIGLVLMAGFILKKRKKEI